MTIQRIAAIIHEKVALGYWWKFRTALRSNNKRHGHHHSDEHNGEREHSVEMQPNLEQSGDDDERKKKDARPNNSLCTKLLQSSPPSYKSE